MSGLVGLGCSHRDSPVFPARSGALVVQGYQTTVWVFDASLLVVLVVGCVSGVAGRCGKDCGVDEHITIGLSVITAPARLATRLLLVG